MNKNAQFFALITFIIVALVIVMTSVIFIYIQDTTETKLKQVIGDREANGKTGNETIDETFAGIGTAYNSLPWLSAFLIIGMIIAVLVGSYMVTTKPVMFVPFIFFMIILVVLGVGISNAYEKIYDDAKLSSSFDRFTASNYILLHLPEVLVVIGFLGAIVMFSRLGRKENPNVY